MTSVPIRFLIEHNVAASFSYPWCSRNSLCSWTVLLIFELFFKKTTYLFSRRVKYDMEGSLDESVNLSEWVTDVCMSHQSDWIYFKQPIKFSTLPCKLNNRSKGQLRITFCLFPGDKYMKKSWIVRIRLDACKKVQVIDRVLRLQDKQALVYKLITFKLFD